MALPVNVVELLRAGQQLTLERDLPVRILFVIEPDAPERLLDAVQGSFRALTTAAAIDVKLTTEVVEGAPIVIPDVALILLGSGNGARESVETLRLAAVPTAGLALTTDEAPIAAASGLSEGLVFSGTTPSDIMANELGPWLVDRLPRARLALANNFPILRRAIAEHVTRTTAWQNSVIGLVAVFPGADLPIMTANQAKMVMQIAAAYGQQLGPERVRELGAVVAGGFLFRAVARQALTFVPGFGWLLKASIAYAGTVAIGRAATEYFEDGADIYTVVARLQMRVGELGDQAAQMVTRGEVPAELRSDDEAGRRLPSLLRPRKREYTVAAEAAQPYAEPSPEPSGASS
jgi:uncharacterized protein (DUF697 family)